MTAMPALRAFCGLRSGAAISDAFVRKCHSLRVSNIVVHRAPPPSPAYKGLEVDFEDGRSFYFSAEFLRVRSPSADSTRASSDGKAKIISGRRHVQILSVEPVGNYGLRIKYDDTHDTGIYTWSYFCDLGTQKFHHMRIYVKALQEAGLSRDSRRRPKEA